MKKYKIGVFGAGRGIDIAKNFMLQNCDIVALCDFHEKRRKHGLHKLGIEVAEYADFDSFIEHDMDAVILANYFHEHAEYAIKCLERGIHVYSECISNGTMAKGVALIRAAEKSKAIYMLGENYPQMLVNREMQRVCQGGTLGKIIYAEGEYNHPVSPSDYKFIQVFRYFEKHWRNYTPATYYITHSLGPVMKATGATPKKVTAFTAFAPNKASAPIASNSAGDRSSMVMTQNDDGSIFRVTGRGGFGAHHNSYRICGTDGQIENVRGMGGKVMLRYNSWSKPEGAEDNNLYAPSWNDKDEDLIIQSGHGGSDFLTVRIFISCIRSGKQPEHPFDVHSAVAMSSTAILAHRAVINGGTYDIPDFHLEECRKQYENDNASPFYGSDGSEPNIPCCSDPNYRPTEEQLKLYKELISTF